MTELKSEVRIINRSDSAIFKFLEDFNNFQKLVPEQVINWQSTTDTCSFSIKGMAELAMKMAKKTPSSFVSYASDGKSPFDFTLNFYISGISEKQSKVWNDFIADLNPMLKMMASRPLQNFVNILIDNLKEVLEGK